MKCHRHSFCGVCWHWYKFPSFSWTLEFRKFGPFFSLCVGYLHVWIGWEVWKGDPSWACNWCKRLTREAKNQEASDGEVRASY